MPDDLDASLKRSEDVLIGAMLASSTFTLSMVEPILRPIWLPLSIAMLVVMTGCLAGSIVYLVKVIRAEPTSFPPSPALPDSGPDGEPCHCTNHLNLRARS